MGEDGRRGRIWAQNDNPMVSMPNRNNYYLSKIDMLAKNKFNNADLFLDMGRYATGIYF